MKQNKPVKTALVYAVDLLAVRAYGTEELNRKLVRKGYEEIEIANAVSRLQERGYLNDAAFLEMAINSYKQMNKYSWREISYKLQQKGFRREAVEEFRELITEADEMAAAQKIIAVKCKNKADIKALLKVKRYLYTHGFSLSAIEKAFVNAG